MSKVIVITGGTSGIGKELAIKYAKENNDIFVIAKDKEKIKKIKKEINLKNINFIKCNLMNNSDIESAFEYIKTKTNKIDLLINNAAYDYMDEIETYDYEIFSKIVNTNLLGKVFCIKNAVGLLKNSEYPNIINIASRLATRPMEKSAAYCCSAAAIVMLTKCAALELEKYLIRVNCISPSLTITPLSLRSYSKEELERTKEKSTRKRLCRIDDIYELINFLSSKKADYINGENIDLNGGILLK